MVIRRSRRISAAFRESLLVKSQTVHSSSPGGPGMRPMGRAFAPPYSLAVTAQQYRTFPIVSRAVASSRCTLSEVVVVASDIVAVAIADLHCLCPAGPTPARDDGAILTSLLASGDVQASGSDLTIESL